MNPYINNYVSLPDNKVDLLIKFLNQNDGKLSKRKREKKFEELTEEEIKNIETRYLEIYNIQKD